MTDLAVAPARRYPFAMPYGWFQVCYPDDLAVGETKALYYFGTHLVAWRDEAGEAHVMDAFCPHLGAHLGHGGSVEGCELVCPFHGWKFDAEGANTDIPYSDRINRKARIRTYPTVERNGLTLVWYHPDERAAPVGGHRDRRADDRRVLRSERTDHVVQAGIQELAENQVDSAHFRFVHNTATVPEIEKYETDGHVAVMRSVQKFPTPRGIVDGRIDTDSDGPGTRHRPLQRHRRHAARHRLDPDRRPDHPGALQLLRAQPRRREDATPASARRSPPRSTGSSRRTRRSGSTRPTSCARRWPTTTVRS